MLTVGIGVRGKLGRSGIADPLGVYGIYRMQRRNGKVVNEKMPFYKPYNPQSSLQTWCRTRFKLACAAWKSLTESERQAYRERASGLPLYGVNIFISEFLLS